MYMYISIFIGVMLISLQEMVPYKFLDISCAFILINHRGIRKAFEQWLRSTIFEKHIKVQLIEIESPD